MSDEATDKRAELLKLLVEIPKSGSFESVGIAERVAELTSDILSSHNPRGGATDASALSSSVSNQK